jgi:hypothetical protein
MRFHEGRDRIFNMIKVNSYCKGLKYTRAVTGFNFCETKEKLSPERRMLGILKSFGLVVIPTQFGLACEYRSGT